MLFFGLVRPYKGVDLLVEALAGTPDDVVLLVVGMPRMPLAPLEQRARELGIADRVRFVPHFVPDADVAAYFRRADLAVLPYREIEQSGVLYTALAFGTPLLLSAWAAFPRSPSTAPRGCSSPGDAGRCERRWPSCSTTRRRGSALSERALALARSEHSWERVAALTEDLYRQLLEERAR